MALDERLMSRIKARARREGLSFQDLANELLRIGIEAAERRPRRRRLPVHDMGEALVDVADREALLDVMDGR